jgi:hypothetical protein
VAGLFALPTIGLDEHPAWPSEGVASLADGQRVATGYQKVFAARSDVGG